MVLNPRISAHGNAGDQPDKWEIGAIRPWMEQGLAILPHLTITPGKRDRHERYQDAGKKDQGSMRIFLAFESAGVAPRLSPDRAATRPDEVSAVRRLHRERSAAATEHVKSCP